MDPKFSLEALTDKESVPSPRIEAQSSVPRARSPGRYAKSE
jgi:hypothetical protein